MDVDHVMGTTAVQAVLYHNNIYIFLVTSHAHIWSSICGHWAFNMSGANDLPKEAN